MTALVSTMQDSQMGGIPGIPAQAKPAELPRPYKCPLCDKAFHRLEHQTRHIKTHTGERPHACHFSGCTKRFSRSDELTRHSRIHNNPNSRRNNRTSTGAAGAVTYAQEHPMMPPPPTSNIISTSHGMMTPPGLSPPHSYIQHDGHRLSNTSPNQRNMDIGLLASAADQVERDSSQAFHTRNGTTSSLAPPFTTYRHNPASLSAYAYSSHSTASTANNSPSMSRSHSPSKPSFTSPQSTAPSSPSFSNESPSPTPDHTPLVTPVHSPRLRPLGNNNSGFHSSTLTSSISHLIEQQSLLHSPNGIHLPALRSLSLSHQSTIITSSSSSYQGPSIHSFPAPALAPLEPRTETSAGSANSTPYGSYTHTGIPERRLEDIMRATDGSQRKLPIPRTPISNNMSGDMMEQ